jgi:hypothetical protein
MVCEILLPAALTDCTLFSSALDAVPYDAILRNNCIKIAKEKCGKDVDPAQEKSWTLWRSKHSLGKPLIRLLCRHVIGETGEMLVVYSCSLDAIVTQCWQLLEPVTTILLIPAPDDSPAGCLLLRDERFPGRWRVEYAWR